MKFFTLIIIIFVLAIGIFGFTFMNHNAGCLFSLENSVDCPQMAIAMALRHISSFNEFFSVIPSGQFFLILLFTLCFFLTLFWQTRPSIEKTFTPLFKLKERGKSRFRDWKIILWLSLFELSPSFFNRA